MNQQKQKRGTAIDYVRSEAKSLSLYIIEKYHSISHNDAEWERLQYLRTTMLIYNIKTKQTKE